MTFPPKIVLVFLCGGVNSNHSPLSPMRRQKSPDTGSTEKTFLATSRCFSVVGSTQIIPPITNAPTKVTRHTGQLKTRAGVSLWWGQLKPFPPYHQCADKSHQTHGRHVFCCGQNPSHILTHRGPIGEGGAKFAQLWQPFHVQFGHLDILSKCGGIGRSGHDRHRPIWSP